MKRHSSHEYPIKDYAIIGNCETAALINPDGGIDWLCLPSFDSPSVFGALLDREKGGEFFIRPRCNYRTEREYVDDSAILQTRFLTEKGTVRLTDWFVIARDRKARFYDFTSLHPARKLVRTLKVESGNSVPIECLLNARPEYGREDVAWSRTSTGPFGYFCSTAKFYSNFAVENQAHQLISDFVANRNRVYFAVLDYGDEHHQSDLENIDRWFFVTNSYWREWNLLTTIEDLTKKPFVAAR